MSLLMGFTVLPLKRVLGITIGNRAVSPNPRLAQPLLMHLQASNSGVEGATDEVV
jgi:hypothetical protein